MSLFVDKHNRRKSPLALAAFGAALLYVLVFGALYAVLAEPLYRCVRLGSPAASTAVHSAIIALAGTAVGCLLFALEDKRIAPLGFAGLAVILGMFYAAALMLEGEARGPMLQLVTMYGLLPVLVGNAVAWPLYCRLKRSAPAPKEKKTIRQELLEAAAQASPPSAPKPPEAPGPESAGGPGSARSEEEEAMRLYMDDDDETGDH